MDAVCITYPKEKFPRFTFFDQKSSELQLRHKKIINETAKQILQPIRFVRLFLCKSSRSKKFPIEISDLLENWETDKKEIEIGETIKYDSLKSFVKCQSGFENSIALLLVDSNSKMDFVSLVTQNVHIILIEHENDAKGKQKVQKDKLKFTTAKKGDISTKVNNLLERSSLAPLKKIAEDCYGSLVKDRNDLSADSAEDLPSLKSVMVGNKFRKVETETGFNVAKPSTKYQNGFVVDNPIDETNGRKGSNKIYPRSVSRSKFQALRKGKKGIRKKPTEPHQVDSLGVKCRSVDHEGGHVDTAESLLEAILALYRMGKVPDTDRPNVPSQSYTICKELRDDLFKICPSIKRIGYRYRTFTIYAAKAKRYKDELNRNRRIESVLKGYGIDKFDLVPCADEIIPLTHVGAKIEARSGTNICLRSRTISSDEVVRNGTLGCITRMNDGTQCGLLSKHVAEDCSEVYYVKDHHKKRFGTILTETTRYRENSLDISAALLFENVDDDKRKFKNIQGHKLQGKLYHYNENQVDEIFGMGQPVYIHGAFSNPGKGEITMPFVHFDLATTLIQVEDAISSNGTVQERFAEEGDSGAVVCADVQDNCVHAVGMVMGKTVERFEKKRRKYLALPLSKGIEQLEAVTGKTFNL